MGNIAVPLIVTFTLATAFLGVLLNSIESHIQTERALVESEQRLHHFAEAGSDYFWELDENLRYSYLSDGFTSLSSLPPGALLGKTRQETGITGVEPEVLEKHFADLDAHRPFRDLRYPRSRPGGRRVFISVSGIPIHDKSGRFCGYRGSASDITEIMKTEEALRQSEERFRDFAEGASHWLWEMDSDLRYTYLSSSFEEYWGVQPAGVVGKTRAELFAETLPTLNADELNHWKELENASKSHQSFHRAEVKWVRPDGEVRFIQTDGKPVFDKDGTFKGYRGVGSDVTDAKIQEEMLRHALKMEAIGQLTGGVAHDFNNLLAVILGNLQLLEKSTGRDERVPRWIRSALDATDRGSELIERLLAFSRKQTLDAKIIDANELLLNIQDLLSRALGEGIELIMQSTENLWLTKVDSSQLETAVLNLAINARDAMVEGGTLTIETANFHLDEDRHSAEFDTEAGDYVLIKVSDTGTGIPADQLDEVLQPFFTTKATGEGSGLGLSMVYGFAKQSGGTVEISSKVGQGTTVKLYLPRDAAAKADARTAVADVGKPVGGSEKILVVEDDPAVRKVTVFMLEELGYQVLKAKDGQSALAVLKEEQVDLLFSDIVMPGGMRGDELAKLAVESNPDLKVLHCTGFGQAAKLRGDTATPDHAVLKKPYRMQDLDAAVRQSLAGENSQRKSEQHQTA